MCEINLQPYLLLTGFSVPTCLSTWALSAMSYSTQKKVLSKQHRKLLAALKE